MYFKITHLSKVLLGPANVSGCGLRLGYRSDAVSSAPDQQRLPLWMLSSQPGTASWDTSHLIVNITYLDYFKSRLQLHQRLIVNT